MVRWHNNGKQPRKLGENLTKHSCYSKSQFSPKREVVRRWQQHRGALVGEQTSSTHACMLESQINATGSVARPPIDNRKQQQVIGTRSATSSTPNTGQQKKIKRRGEREVQAGN